MKSRFTILKTVKRILTIIIFLIHTVLLQGQVLYVPEATGSIPGIGSSQTTNVGIGIRNPQTKLHLYEGSGSGTHYLKMEGISEYATVGFLFKTPTTDMSLTTYRNTMGIMGGNVGIGTTSPYAKLSVIDSYKGIEFTPYWEHGNGPVIEVIDRSAFERMDFNLYTGNNGGHIKFYTSASEKVRITKEGNLGVSTTSPFSKISFGTGSAFNSSAKRFAIEEGSDGAYFYGIGGSGNYGKEGLGLWGGTESELPWNGNTGIKPHMFIVRNSGHVGIGTIEPGNYKLNVAGTIRANEIIVNTNGADFVFDPTYNLRSLNELETFILENKHLPDIAPAKEMQENGVSSGEMHAKLLQKVEELTLYLIEKDKQLEEQIKINVEQQQILCEIKKEMKLLKKY